MLFIPKSKFYEALNKKQGFCTTCQEFQPNDSTKHLVDPLETQAVCPTCNNPTLLGATEAKLSKEFRLLKINR